VTIAGRLAQVIRGPVLAAAQAGLRSIREALAQLPTDRARTHATPSAAIPASGTRSTPLAPVVDDAGTPGLDRGASAPSADLLRAYTPLPQSYGSERLVLLARDPHCLFAYWDVSEARRQNVRQQAGSDNLRTILRAYDVSQVAFDAAPPSRFQDFAVAGEARSVYAYVGKPAACFVAEIGYLRPDGAFFPLARSQPIWTPRTEQPGIGPGRWMTVGWSERPDAGALLPSEASPGLVASPTPVDGLAAGRRAPSSWPGPIPSAGQRGSWSLVRGGLGTAVPVDDATQARSEP
jgi:hypothetical protein